MNTLQNTMNSRQTEACWKGQSKIFTAFTVLVYFTLDNWKDYKIQKSLRIVVSKLIIWKNRYLF